MVQLIRARRADGLGGGPWPDLTAAMTPRLEDGEVVQWRGKAEASQCTYYRPPGADGDFELVWSLKDTALVLVTDRRVIFGGKILEPQRKVPAELRDGLPGRTAKAADAELYLGQVRFEWVANVRFNSYQQLGMKMAAVSLVCVGADGRTVMILLMMQGRLHGAYPPQVSSLARAMAAGVAAHRLAARGGELSVDDSLALTAMRDGGAPAPLEGGMRWDLPGEVRVEDAGPPPGMAPADVVPPEVAPPVELVRRERMRLPDVLTIVVAVALVVVGLAGVPGIAATRNALNARNQARAATAAGDLRSAARSWFTVLRLAPRSTEALLRLACLSWDAGYQDEAVTYYERALVAGVRWNQRLINADCLCAQKSRR